MVNVMLLSAIGLTAVLVNFNPAVSDGPGEGRQSRTEWEVRPSLKYDLLCLANVLSGDSFYLDYYREEYRRFQPLLDDKVRTALGNLRRRIKDERHTVVSAFLCLHCSTTDDESLGGMIRSIADREPMRRALIRSPYYNQDAWCLFDSLGEDLEAILTFCQKAGLDRDWRDQTLPLIQERISAVGPSLADFDVIGEIESQLGRPTRSDHITVYLLFYAEPHRIRITGNRFLTDYASSREMIVADAVHELMHPPYDLARDVELREAIARLGQNPLLAESFIANGWDFGYSTFEGFFEEACVQALEQVVCERLNVAVDAHRRWRDTSNGMRILAAVLYQLMREEDYRPSGITFGDFLCHLAASGRLSPFRMQDTWQRFWSETDSAGRGRAECGSRH